MKFIIKDYPNENDFRLIYREDEYSFDVEPGHEIAFSSILINYLQIEIDDLGYLLYVWGFCPLVKIIETKEEPKGYIKKTLQVISAKEIIPGISVRLNDAAEWPVYVNKMKEWVCIGDPITTNKQLIEFAPRCVASFDQEKMVALWLQPYNWKTVGSLPTSKEI